MAGILKKTTGLTGLAVSTRPHAELQLIYDKILRLLNKLPQDYFYRTSVEKLVKERSKILRESDDIAVVEEKIGHGQIETIIIDAKDELSLLETMLQHKPWQNLMEKAPAHQWTWPPYK
ncbi:NADH dehydrogenase [ubiquinone] 1 alpha subcomplex subunit 5 [Anthophora retusa]